MYALMLYTCTFEIRYTSRGQFELCINLSPEGALIPLLSSYATCMFPRSVTNDTTAIRSWSQNFGYVFIVLQRICMQKLVHRWSFESFVSGSRDSENLAFCFYAMLIHDFEPRLDAVWCFLFRGNTINYAITTLEK